MDPNITPRILTAERLTGGVVIQFSDGKCALYSASLLYDTLPKAEELYEEPSDSGW